VDETPQPLSKLLGPGAVTPHAVQGALQSSRDRAIAIFVHEFDRFQDPAGRVLFADTITSRLRIRRACDTLAGTAAHVKGLLVAVSLTELALGVAMISLLSGCGGDSTSETDQVGAEFAAQALEVCREALEDKQSWEPFPVASFDPLQPDPSQFVAVSGWLAGEVAPTFEEWLAELEALDTPPSGQEAWDKVLAAVEDIVELNGAQVRAANENDMDAFAAAARDLEARQDELVVATEEAGVAECADVHG
jgi:hypothetical protein